MNGQRNINRTTLRRAVEAESQMKDMEDRSSGLEGELLSSDVERDQLREDRDKVNPLILNLHLILPIKLLFISKVFFFAKAIFEKHITLFTVHAIL